MVERVLERHLPQALVMLETARRKADTGSLLTAAGSKLEKGSAFSLLG